MLQFIIGKSGTGKSTALENIIEEKVKTSQKCLLIVPEQASFAAEKRAYQKLGPRGVLGLEVLSLTRLCNNVFREFGGLAGISLDDTAKYMLMAIAVNQLEGSLKTYKKSSNNFSFLKTLISTCNEFKAAGVTPEALSKTKESIENKNLKNKLDDIHLVYEAYQALIENGYSDPEDSMIKAVEILENNNYFKDFNIFIDGFTTFMSVEFQLIKHIIMQSKSVIITLTTNNLINNDYDVFSVVKKAGIKLENYAKDTGVIVKDPIILSEFVKYDNDELKKLSADYMNLDQVPYSKNLENIRLIQSDNPYNEVLAVAAEIVRLVREDGARFSDIAVISRSTDAYESLFSLIFTKYEIPYFMDKRIEVEDSPLILGLMSALECIRTNFAQEAVLALAKSPIMGMTLEESAYLENYAYIWQIKGRLWQEEFTSNPRGMVSNLTDADCKALGRLNQSRIKLLAAIQKLKEKVLVGTGKSFAIGLYEFMEDINAANNLKLYAEVLPEENKDSFIQLNARIYDTTIDIIDIFAKIISESKLSLVKMIDLFKLAISSADIGVLPQTLDHVLIGGADRIRPENIKSAFVIGANEGFFPRPVAATGVFSTKERDLLNDAGLEIGGTGLHQSLLENFFVYFALTVSTSRLYVSYSSSTNKGEELFESSIISYLKETFPKLTKESLTQNDYIQNVSSLTSVLSEVYSEDTPLRATLVELFSGDESIVNDLEKASTRREHRLEEESNIRDLFGQSIKLSPSKVERFNKCNFAFFANDGLKLKKRKKVEFSPLESGSIIHHILQVMLQKYGGYRLSKLSLELLGEEVEKIITQYLDERVSSDNALTSRTKFLFNRLCSTMAGLLHHIGEEFSQSDYEPVEFELKIGNDEKVRPLQLQTEGGISVSVEGIVDRVDVMEKDGEKYIRVVDYKSSQKDFRLEDVLYGLNLQMLLYLFTIAENGGDQLGGAVPTGILYMPVRAEYSTLGRNVLDKDAKDRLMQSWKMSGILLDDPEVLSAMEQDLSGIYIPAKVKKNGELNAYSSVASSAELGRIANEVKEQIKKVAMSISDGQIDNYPIEDADYPTCKYCEYRSVCGYEEGDPVRTIERMSRQDVFAKLEKEEGNA